MSHYLLIIYGIKSIFSRLRRFKVYISLAIIIGIILTLKTSFAAQESYFQQKQSARDTCPNQECWIYEATGSHLETLSEGFIGKIPKDVFENKVQSFIPGGAVGAANNFISSLYTPQASGISYVAQLKDNFLGKPAYAQQGIGFNGLLPLLPLWRGFRNMVYVLFALAFIVIGVMIIFRVKISPQTIVTVQNAIPKLVASLILLTFSYAIAGFIIDLSYLVQSMFVALMFTIKGVDLKNNLFGTEIFGWNYTNSWFNQGPIKAIFDYITGSNAFNFSNLSNPSFRNIQVITYNIVPTWSLFLLSTMVGSIVTGTLTGGVLRFFTGNTGRVVAGGVGEVAGAVLGGIGGILVLVIIEIFVIIWLIKLYFGLLKAYILIIFKIITAPFEIGAGAFPNSPISFSSWLRDLIAQVAVFPGVIIFLVLLNYIVSISGNLWVPNMLDAGIINGSNIIQAALGIGGLAMLSSLPDKIPQFIFSIKPSPWGAAIGENTKPIQNIAKGAALYPVNRLIDDSETKFKDAQAVGGQMTQAIADRHAASQVVKRFVRH